MRIMYVVSFALAAVLIAAQAAVAMPTVEELIERADNYARQVKQYTCQVAIEDSTGTATGRLRAREDKFQLEYDRKNEEGGVLGKETLIFDGKTIWMLVIPTGEVVPSVLKMDVKLIEEHARKTKEDILLDRPDRGINPFKALSSLRTNYQLEAIEEIKADHAVLVMVEARLKPFAEREPAWTGAPLIRLLIEQDHGIPFHIARFDYEGRRVFSMTLGEGNTRVPVRDNHVSYSPPRRAEVQDVAEMLAEIDREREEVLRRVD